MKPELAEKFSWLKSPMLSRTSMFATFAIAAVWFSNNSGAVQEVEPMKIPDNAVRIGKQKTISKTFRLPQNETDQIFCGKVRVRFQPDYESSKTVTDLGRGVSEVECSTDGYDIPFKRVGL